MTRAALLFDLDGTLVETDDLHHAAFAGILAEDGRALSFDEYRDRILGKPNAEIMAWLMPEAPHRHAEIADRKEAAYRAMLAAEIEPVAGVGALLDWADAAGVAIAVVTNAPRRNAEAVLAAAGLADRFATLVIGEECARAKPDPLPYQEAMRRLRVTPSHAIAFEDSRSGLRAARGAGAQVFGLTTTHTAAELLQAGAHQAIPDFADPALWVALESLKARVA